MLTTVRYPGDVLASLDAYLETLPRREAVAFEDRFMHALHVTLKGDHAARHTLLELSASHHPLSACVAGALGVAA